MISTARPAGMPDSSALIAKEYASCPVLAAADQIRSGVLDGRAANRNGSACVRK
jgi:hypothetical protein